MPLPLNPPPIPMSSNDNNARKAASDSVSIRFRQEIVATDLTRVRQMLAATGKFYPDEIDVAAELIEERLLRGGESGYEFIVAETDDPLFLGFSCFGKIPCTRAAFDLYWIAVEPTFQSRGIGRKILAAVESAVRLAGGTHLYADTSGRPDYENTRQYYRANGFQEVALLEDFYAPGDAKIIYRKTV
jgi:D-alanine-D-alanine ligase